MVLEEINYSFWEGSLAGEDWEIHAEYPQPGFYKARFGGRNAPYIPVAIWLDAGQWQCKVGYDDLFHLRNVLDVWTWCCNRPISYAVYRTVCLTHQWPSKSDNSEILLDAAQKAIASSEDGGELESLYQQLEIARKKANQEHLDAKRMVDAKFKQATNQLKERMKQLKEERA